MKVKITATVTPAWQRAAARAAEDRAAGRLAERVGCRTYRMPSASGSAAHTIVIQSVTHLLATCDCLAGQRGLACRHAAAALCEATRRIATAPEVTAPASEPEPSASVVVSTAATRRRTYVDEEAQRIARTAWSGRPVL